MIKPPKMKPAPRGTPKRPSGQFQSARETAGKINGGGFGQPQHPQTHDAWEKL